MLMYRLLADGGLLLLLDGRVRGWRPGAGNAGTAEPWAAVGLGVAHLVGIGVVAVLAWLGADCLLCAQAAVAGSAVLGPRVILGGKSGVADNLTIGRDVVVGGGAIVLGNVDDGVFVSGHPAQPTHDYRAAQRALRRLARR